MITSKPFFIISFTLNYFTSCVIGTSRTRIINRYIAIHLFRLQSCQLSVCSASCLLSFNPWWSARRRIGCGWNILQPVSFLCLSMNWADLWEWNSCKDTPEPLCFRPSKFVILDHIRLSPTCSTSLPSESKIFEELNIKQGGLALLFFFIKFKKAKKHNLNILTEKKPK